MSTYTYRPLDLMTLDEKIQAVERTLQNMPDCPIPQQVIPHLTEEQKLDLFDTLIQSGGIKLFKAGG